MVKRVNATSSGQSDIQFNWLLEQSDRTIRRNQRRQRARSQAQLLALDMRMQELQDKNRDLQAGEQPVASSSAGLANQLGWVLDRFL